MTKPKKKNNKNKNSVNHKRFQTVSPSGVEDASTCSKPPWCTNVKNMTEQTPATHNQLKILENSISRQWKYNNWFYTDMFRCFTHHHQKAPLARFVICLNCQLCRTDTFTRCLLQQYLLSMEYVYINSQTMISVCVKLSVDVAVLCGAVNKH